MNSENPVRFAYVGCGFVGQSVHIPNFASLPDCDFQAIAEPRGDLGQSVARRYNIAKVYASHLEICADDEIEAVGVSAPYTIQARVAEDLLAAGKHVFMEKPMAVSVARAQEMVAASQRGKGRLMVGYMKRYDKGNVRLKELLDQWRASGEAGDLIYARNHGFCGADWTYGRDPNVPFETSADAAPPAPDDCPEWIHENKRNSYLSYLQQWTHNVNLLRYFLGDDGGKTFVKSVQLDCDGMTGLVVLEINGTRAIVESAGTQAHGWEEHTQVYFRGGWLKTGAPALLQKENPASLEIYRAAQGEILPQLTHEFAPPSWAFREEAKHFLSCIRSGKTFRSSAEDTLNDVQIFEEIYRYVV